MSKLNNEATQWSRTSNSGDMINFVGTHLVKNHVNSCHGNNVVFFFVVHLSLSLQQIFFAFKFM